MKNSPNGINKNRMDEAVHQLRKAAAARKCWACGCLHDSLAAIERAFPVGRRPAELDPAIRAARQRLVPVRYDCRGCEPCYPPLAMNALNIGIEACPAEKVQERAGWPPLPGSYKVLRYHAPVAVCTLTDEKLSDIVAEQAGPEAAIVGTLQTENLGIERLIQNTLANPHVRFLILCGADSRQKIGHLPGQSLLALVESGIDSHGRIIGANGKRPVFRNIGPEVGEHFRRTVEAIDMIGVCDLSAILAAASQCAARNPGPAEPFLQEQVVPVVQGYVQRRMAPDPAGYFVIYADHQRGRLSMEHYTNEGVLDTVIVGRSSAELYLPTIDRGLVSRLDHAAYLGRELDRAEQSLVSGEPYVQDAAPECQEPQAACACNRTSSRGES